MMNSFLKTFSLEELREIKVKCPYNIDGFSEVAASYCIKHCTLWYNCPILREALEKELMRRKSIARKIGKTLSSVFKRKRPTEVS